MTNPDADLDQHEVEELRRRANGEPSVPFRISVAELRLLREKARRAPEVQERAARLERSLSFWRAGVSTSDRASKYFVRGYDGPLDEASIQRAYLEGGFVDSDDD